MKTAVSLCRHDINGWKVHVNGSEGPSVHTEPRRGRCRHGAEQSEGGRGRAAQRVKEREITGINWPEHVKENLKEG